MFHVQAHTSLSSPLAVCQHTEATSRGSCGELDVFFLQLFSPHGHEDFQEFNWDEMTCRIQLLFILFIFTFCVCAESFVVNVTQSFYQAKENHSITMEWIFPTDSRLSLNSLSVFCRLSTHIEVFILFDLNDGVEVPESQDEYFAGRVQLDKDVLLRGRVRLQVSRLRISDSGLYSCDVLTDYGTDSEECWLHVSARYRHKPGTASSPTRSPQPKSQEWIIVSFRAMRLMAALLAFLLFILIRIYI